MATSQPGLHALADLIPAAALVAVILVLVGVGILAVRDFRRGRWPCPHCGRIGCDRGCIERGED